MTGYPSLTVRMWHTMVWRRNALMRGSDRLESALMVLAMALALLAIPVSAAIGSTVFVSVSATAQQQAATRHQTTAVVVDQPTAGFSVDTSATTKVQWTIDGVVREGTTAARGAQAGDTMTIWTDENGDQTSPPISGVQAIGEAVSTSFICWSVVGGTLLLFLVALRRLLNRHRYAQWGREWQTVANSRGWASP